MEAHIQESLRQAAEQPKIQDLIGAMENAVYRKSQEKHYAWLASQLFGQHIAATKLQAAWRRYTARKWYLQYRKTEEFNKKQAEYEAQEQVSHMFFWLQLSCSIHKATVVSADNADVAMYWLSAFYVGSDSSASLLSKSLL
jgi:hypothetical protein